MNNFLDFEKPIAELEAKIDSLKNMNSEEVQLDINLDEEIKQLNKKNQELTKKNFSNLTPWQIDQL